MHKLHRALHIQLLKQKKFTRGIFLDELKLTNSYASWAERACYNEQASD